MEIIKNEIISNFESFHYTDKEMIEALKELRDWCDKSIKKIREQQ